MPANSVLGYPKLIVAYSLLTLNVAVFVALDEFVTLKTISIFEPAVSALTVNVPVQVVPVQLSQVPPVNVAVGFVPDPAVKVTVGAVDDKFLSSVINCISCVPVGIVELKFSKDPVWLYLTLAVRVGAVGSTGR